MLTEGKHQEIVCGADNFEVGDLVVVVAARRRAARRLRDLGAQDLRPDVQRDDLRRGRDRPRPRPRGHHRARRLLGEETAATLQPGRRRDRPARARRGDRRDQRDARPWLLLLGARPGPRVLARPGQPRRAASATRPTSRRRRPTTTATPSSSRTSRRSRATTAATATSRGSSGASTPRAHRRRGCSKRLTQMGMRPISLAVDVTNYVMLALGQPLHAFDVDRLVRLDRRAPGPRRRDADDPRRRRAHPHPDDLLITDGGEQPLAIAGVMGGASSEVVRHDDRRPHRGGALRPDDRRALVAPAPARHRGVQALRARRRPEAGRGRRAARRRPARRARRRHRRRRRDRRRPHDRAARHTCLDVTEPTRASSASTTRASGSSASCATSAARSTRPARRTDDTHVLVTPPSLASRPRRRARLRRGGRADRRLQQHPVDHRRPRATGRGLTHAQKARRVVADALAGAGLRRGAELPVRRRGARGRSSMLPGRRRPSSGGPAGQPAVRGAAAAAHVGPREPRRRAAPQRRRAATRTSRSTSSASSSARAARSARRRSRASPRVPTPRRSSSCMRPCPPSPAARGVLATGQAEQAGLVGSGPRRRLERRGRGGPDGGRGARGRPVVVANDPSHAPWHPGRCARITLADGTLVGHAGELHPKVLAALELPRAHRGGRVRRRRARRRERGAGRRPARSRPSRRP